MQNVHLYDGMLPHVNIIIFPNKMEITQRYHKRLIADNKQMAANCVHKIICQIGHPCDEDPKNHHYKASDLLCMCIKYVEHDLLCEQLTDIMLHGQCIQGQVIRLFQLVSDRFIV